LDHSDGIGDGMTETQETGGGQSGAGEKGNAGKSYPFVRKIPFIGQKLADRMEMAPVVPVIRLTGVVGDAGRFQKSGLTLADLAEPIDKAFEEKNAVAVALIVNSPGGSPVQSDLIAKRIRLLAAEKDRKIIAFCEDAAASGGYWLACAADEIYAADASVVGSIGVISAGFGFPALLEKAGIERRVYTAGEAKSQLDPFQPENQDDIKRLLTLQKDIHDQFTGWVKERRGDRLKATDKKLFSGEFWTGRQALELGLVDGLGEIRTICRGKFGDNVKLPVMTPRKSWIQRLVGLHGPEGFGSDLAGALPDALFQSAERRSWWARLGL